MQVITIPALSDNYIYLLLDDNGRELAAVDPGVAEPVLRYLQKTGMRLTAILNTHHHHDHAGGNGELVSRYPGIPVLGGARDRGRIPEQTLFLSEGAEIRVSGVKAKILETPGHTKGHIAYFFAGESEDGDLFSGDTVFGGTIGNLFEGTPAIMFESIRKIRALPRNTRIWCAHEYTLQYVRESAGIDPVNERLRHRLKRLESETRASAPTVPLSLEEECETNPFFRWDDPGLSARLAQPPGLATFRHLCEMT
jgi:hydroxyacylglutathione hydrolase